MTVVCRILCTYPYYTPTNMLYYLELTSTPSVPYLNTHEDLTLSESLAFVTRHTLRE